ncbi:MAG: type IV pilin N-terminal domain-containing protein, partial [Candidatus Thermoplasmatota archaeon]|nr:type IV pilin N-terminal domain-containing protein [Candidatus Thermoplasmatota archaeon]
MKIKEKEAVSPVIGVILMVAITVVLAAVLYVWVSGFMGGGAQTPTISLGMVTVKRNETLPGWANVSWPIAGVSRADIKWDEISLTVSLNGITTVATTYKVYETDVIYVKAGHTVGVNITT